MSSGKTNPFIDIFSGGIGGVCSVLVGHSLDTMKVRLQTMPHNEISANIYTTTLNSFRNIIKNEGFLALYKGVQAPLLGAIPTYALYFFSYNLGKNIQKPALDNGQYSIGQFFTAGAFSGLCTLVFSVPIERVKCLMQIEKTNKYNGMLDCTRKVFKSSGLKGLYRGFLLTLYRDVPASGIYFATYEYIKKLLKKDDDLSPFRTVIAGGTAGVSYWIIGLPIDTLKSCYQTAPEGKYNSITDVYKDLTKFNGIRSLYRGLIPVLIRTFPSTGACFLGYEISYYFFFNFSNKNNI